MTKEASLVVSAKWVARPGLGSRSDFARSVSSYPSQRSFGKAGSD